MSSLRCAPPKAEKPEGGDGRPRPGRTLTEDHRAKIAAGFRRRNKPAIALDAVSWIDPEFDERF